MNNEETKKRNRKSGEHSKKDSRQSSDVLPGNRSAMPEYSC